MRTVPKSLSTFRQMIEERGARLRALRFDQLKRLGAEPLEHVTVESRPATIGIIVQPMSDGRLRVVVQGFMKARFLGKHVALDGFYKHPDEAVAPMSSKAFYEFD